MTTPAAKERAFGIVYLSPENLKSWLKKLRILVNGRLKRRVPGPLDGWCLVSAARRLADPSGGRERRVAKSLADLSGINDLLRLG